MPQLLVYNSSAEPPCHFAEQIHSALLAEWPAPDTDVRGGSLIAPELHPTYFLLVERNRLLSYARTIWMTVAHNQQHFKLYGLGDVLTVPQCRHQGYGNRLVQEATAHLSSDPEADAALLLTRPELAELYRRSGWEHVPGLRVVTGEYDGHESGDVFPMMLFLPAAAHVSRESFASQTLVLPGDEW